MSQIQAATRCSLRKQSRLPRRVAVGTSRHALRVCGAIILLASTHVPSAAEGSEIRAAYDLLFGGLTIGKADVRIAIRGKGYTVRVNYGTSGAARLMGRANGEAVSTGAFMRGRLVPTTFNLAHQGSQRTQKINLAMSAGSVDAMTIDPPVKPRSPGTPITGKHLKNVTDPLSALFLPAAGPDGKSESGACDRTVQVFDGMRRFDVTLKRKETRMANRGPYVGLLAACEIQITHIAGQTRDESRTPNRPLSGIEVTFGVLDVHKIYVPVSLSAKMGYLTIGARLTQLSRSNSE